MGGSCYEYYYKVFVLFCFVLFPPLFKNSRCKIKVLVCDHGTCIIVGQARLLGVVA